MFLVLSCITGKSSFLELRLVTPEMPRTAAVVTKFLQPLLGHGRTLRVENLYNSPDLAKQLKIEQEEHLQGSGR